MIGVVLFLLVVVAIGLIIYVHSDPPASPKPPDPEYLNRAAVELHRIRRRREAADLKHRQRRDAARLGREIAEALDEES
jgi:hypothetical protein